MPDNVTNEVGGLPRVVSSGPVNLEPGQSVIVKVKYLTRSKTFWIGLVITVIAILQYIGELPMLAEYREVLTGIAGVLMIIMRAISNQPVALK